MYENESNKVKEGIEYLRELLVHDFPEEKDSALEEIRERLDEIQGDIDFLVSNLPYEVLGDIDEERKDTGDDLLEEGELEDEVVEADKLIDDARELLFSVNEKYFGDETEPSYAPSEAMNAVRTVNPYSTMNELSTVGRDENKLIDNDRILTHPKRKFKITIDLILAIAIFVTLILSCILE